MHWFFLVFESNNTVGNAIVETTYDLNNHHELQDFLTSDTVLNLRNGEFKVREMVITNFIKLNSGVPKSF